MALDSPAPSLTDGFLRSALDWQATLMHQLLDLHDKQLQSIGTWQRLFNDANQDLWDRWNCRFGGGVPLDG